MPVTWHKLPEIIKLAFHHTRHEDGGDDEIDITTFDEIILQGDFEGGVLGGMSNLNDYIDIDFDGGAL